MKNIIITTLIISLLLSVLCCHTTKTKNIEESLFDMVFVQGGSFDMGSNDWKSTEKPVHSVTVDSFYISTYEVTQGQWEKITGTNPAENFGIGDNYPVYNVSWQDAIDFCNTLSTEEGLTPCYSGKGAGVTCDFTANGYRLPTEAEWEYAARGGTESNNFLYAGSDNAGEAGWHSGNAQNTNHEAGLKKANELGLYDMSGNVWEWCWDWYNAKYYASSPSDNPTGPSNGTYRVLRGGSRGINENGLRCTNRYMGAHRSDESTGFRCVRKG